MQGKCVTYVRALTDCLEMYLKELAILHCIHFSVGILGRKVFCSIIIGEQRGTRHFKWLAHSPVVYNVHIWRLTPVVPMSNKKLTLAVADPGFPVGGRGPV